jgi:hypothetical protein
MKTNTIAVSVKLLSIMLLLTLFLAACADASAQPEKMVGKQPVNEADKVIVDQSVSGENLEAMSEPEHDNQAMSDPAEVDGMEKQDEQNLADGRDEMMESPTQPASPLLSLPITNPATGETFTLSDFSGKVILVETMAMWCSNCFRQQNQVKVLHDLISDRDDFISLGIDIDLNEVAEDLIEYTSSNGFDWTYAVATKEFAREISQSLGDQFLNPPSTPMFIIDRKGEIHPLRFGIKDSQELLEVLQPFLDEGI